MPVLQSKPRATNATVLNATPLSVHVMTLFEQAKTKPVPGLVLVALLWWAAENHPELAEVEAIAAAAEADELADPKATYERLATEELLATSTLEQAARMLVRLLQP